MWSKRIKLNFIRNSKRFLIEKTKILSIVESCQTEDQTLRALDWAIATFDKRKSFIERNTFNINFYSSLLSEIDFYRTHVEGICFNKLKNL